MHTSLPVQERSIGVQAFGQHWRFTSSALSALAHHGIGSPTSLKSVVVNLTTHNGLEDGRYEVRVYEVELLLRVRGDQVQVEDLYAY